MAELITLLNMMRMGKVDDAGMEILRSLRRPVVYSDGIQPTEL